MYSPFFLLWIGLGFLITGAITSQVEFGSVYEQIAAAVTIGGVLLLLLRRKMLNYMANKPVEKEEQMHKGGIAVFNNGAFKFEGTYWQTDADISHLNEGDKVEIKILHNKAVLV